MAKDKKLSAGEVDALESKYVSRRIAALRLNPIKGNFDVDHLKAINHYLFQDLPKLGLDHVTPGEFRKTLSPYSNWIKHRQLEGMDAIYTVYYSTMSADTLNKLKNVLSQADSAEFSRLGKNEFAERIGGIYSRADFVHPFLDGNSRTLREFTRLLAMESGYKIDWEILGQSAGGRNHLYVARDTSVLEIASKELYTEEGRRGAEQSLYQISGNRSLPELIKEITTPIEKQKEISIKKDKEIEL